MQPVGTASVVSVYEQNISEGGIENEAITVWAMHGVWAYCHGLRQFGGGTAAGTDYYRGKR
jgi:hypothetical protein